jgi:ABC-type branched-subunit amino acid transport system substrate-binding protein
MARIRRRPDRVAFLTVAALVIGVGCGEASYREDPLPDLGPDARFVPVDPPLTTDSPAASIRGVVRSRTVPMGFHDRIMAVDPSLTDVTGAAEAYDAVIISALAAEKARTDAPARIATEIVGVTNGSALCVTFHDCRLEIDSGGEPDYDGVSSGVALLPNGEPAEVALDVVEIVPNGSLRIDDTVTVVLDDPAARPPVVDPKLGFRGDGILRFATLLPVNGPDGDLARAALAGVRLAVDEINLDSGVLGDPVELLADESGDGSAGAITTAVERLVDAGADVVIGGTDGSIDRVAVNAVTSAGLVLFSPTDGDRAVATIPDGGRFFRLANLEAAEGRALATLVAQQGLSRVAIIVGGDEASVDLKDDFASGLAAASVDVVATIALTPTSETDFVVLGATGASPDAIVILATATDAAPLLRELIRIGSGPSTVATFGSSAVVSPDLVRLLES